MQGQLTIFDFIKEEKQPTSPKCGESCEAYPLGCGGTIKPCRFGGPYHWENKKVR